MSLLNDALRAAEERQTRPEVAAAYTGSHSARPRSGLPWLLVIVILLMLAAASAYWLLSGDDARPVPAIAEKSPLPQAISDDEVVQETLPLRAVSGDLPQNAKSTEAEPKPKSESMPRVADQPKTGTVQRTKPLEETNPETVNKPAELTEAAEIVASEPSRQPVAEVAPETTAAVEPEPRQAPAKPQPKAKPQPQPAPETASDSEADAPVVKRTAQTPEAIDRQTARELEVLMAGGDTIQAERQLSALVQEQNAPRSRFAVARSLLVDGYAGRALQWLPESVAMEDAEIRMLRARALHSQQQVDQAVALLASQVPPVADNAEYRITLATLLQQQGSVQEAARQWAELIAWDDTRAPWWVGLAIALEDQGEIRSATRAYEQAASLPGLPPSLVDYVQQRLRALRAG